MLRSGIGVVLSSAFRGSAHGGYPSAGHPIPPVMGTSHV
ncbi:hypothetical protein GZL_03446 [Streptomyces sp. 769]|nr:hypothetical protein GZL_03446 [Streptomyces sp. 769]